MASSDKPGNEKNSLLSKWLKRKKGKQAINRVQAGELAPLSYQQQRLWFLQQLHPENPFYHYAELYRFQGPLRQEVLEKSLYEIVQRHDILKSYIHLQDGVARQKRETRLAWQLDYENLENVSPSQEEMLHQKAYKEARKPFDLARPPLFRMKLFRCGPKLHYFLFTAHHMITDKWSMRVFRKELAELYAAYQQGNPSPLPPISYQYLDYAKEQRAKEIPAQNVAYWQNRFSGELPKLPLAQDKIRPARATYAGAYIKRPLKNEVLASFQTLGKEINGTMYVLFLSAYKVLLHRYTGQEDILVGSPFTNRDQVELEKLIGFFNDTLVLRSQIQASMTFTEVVEQVKKTVLEGFGHKDMPFEALLQSIKAPRSMGENPMFQVMFLYHQVPPTPPFVDHLELDYEPFDLGVAKFDFTLYLEEKEDSLQIIVEYSKDLFEAETIERFLDHYEELLRSIIVDPRQTIGEINILPPSEKEQLLAVEDPSYAPTLLKQIVPYKIEQKAQEMPQNIALVFQNQKMSYAQLLQWSRSLAATLQAQGVQKNTLVGLYLERSIEIGPGILGILLSGAAYLPLDPDYPEERIQYMLEDSHIKFVVCLSASLPVFSALPVTTISLDALGPEMEIKYQAPSLQAEDLAYQIYTSGSTGKPKGVPISHGNLAHSNGARFTYYPENPECFLLMSSFAFDSSVAGIFWTLSSGGKLLISEKRSEQDPIGLGKLIQKEQVSHTLMLPTLYKLLLNLGEPAQLSSLRTVIVAGEACPSDLVKVHFEKAPHIHLYNEYGPTEATVWCTVHHIEKKDAHQKVPIGQAIPHTQIYILDTNRQLCPIGLPGELYIGGPGLSAGYWQREDLNKQKFVANPFLPGAQLYKTGDRARWKPDGYIEFLGRNDEQVKIRGNRVELDEIKALLLQSDLVEDALVVVKAKSPTNISEKLLAADKQALQGALEKIPEEDAIKLLEFVASKEDQEVISLLNTLKQH